MNPLATAATQAAFWRRHLVEDETVDSQTSNTVEVGEYTVHWDFESPGGSVTYFSVKQGGELIYEDDTPPPTPEAIIGQIVAAIAGTMEAK